MLALLMWLPTAYDASALVQVVALLLIAVGLVASLLADAKLQRWYRQRFGATTATPSDQRTDWTYVGVLAAFTVAGGIIAITTAYSYVAVFAAMALGAAVMAFLKRRRFGGWAPCDVAATVSIALGTAWMAFASPADGTILTWPLFAAIGVGAIVGGLLEHRLLVQTLPGVKTDDVDAV